MLAIFIYFLEIVFVLIDADDEQGVSALPAVRMT